MPFSQSAKKAVAGGVLLLAMLVSSLESGSENGSGSCSAAGRARQLTIEIRDPGCAACVKKALSDLEASKLEGVQKISLSPGHDKGTLCILMTMSESADGSQKEARGRVLSKTKAYLKSRDFEIIRIR